MYIYRHLLVYLQQMFPADRASLTGAWSLLQRWELIQPVAHRPPLPRIILDALISLSLELGLGKVGGVDESGIFWRAESLESLLSLGELTCSYQKIAAWIERFFFCRLVHQNLVDEEKAGRSMRE